MGSQDPRNDRLARSWIAARCSVVVSFSARSCPSLSLPYLFDPSSSPFFHSIPNVRIPCCLFLSTRMALYDVPSADHATRHTVFLFFFPFRVAPREPRLSTPAPFSARSFRSISSPTSARAPDTSKTRVLPLFPVCRFPPTRPPNSLLAARDKIRFRRITDRPRSIRYRDRALASLLAFTPALLSPRVLGTTRDRVIGVAVKFTSLRASWRRKNREARSMTTRALRHICFRTWFA